MEELWKFLHTTIGREIQKVGYIDTNLFFFLFFCS